MTQRNMVRTKSNLRFRDKHKLSGIILVVVLVVIAMLALAAYTFTDLMLTEKEAAILNGQQIQARNLVDSGVEQVKVYLEMTEDVRYASGGEFDNPALFQAVQVTTGVNATARGRFTVISPMMDSQGMWGGVRFGLEDESGRLNLNALDLALPDEEDADAAALEAAVDDILDSGDDDPNAGTAGVGNTTGGAVPSGANSGGGTTGGASSGGTNDADDTASDESTEEEEEPIDTSGRAMLMKLPGMTVDIADAILDYVDEDDEPREYGAESSYYSSLSYAAKNGPLETVEELLMVRGVTPDLLFGRDINRNGIIDMHELNLPLTGGFDDGTGAMDRGWSAYLTLFSAERNVNQEGLPKVNLNEEDLQTLYDQLTQVLSDPGWATFIVAYRQNGPDSNESTSAEAEAPGDQALDFSRPARFPVTQVLDLVGVNVRARLAENAGSVILASPFSDQPLEMGAYMSELMDNCTVNPATVIPGRINVNQAPWTVLMAIPGMTEQIADSIISQRDMTGQSADPNFQHPTWLLTRAVVTLEEMRDFMPYTTARGSVFRTQVVGYFDEGGISSRAEVVIGATEANPRVLFWRDISHLGRGYPKEVLGVVYQP